MSPLQIASVYVRQDDYIIQTQSRTTAGIWIGCEPVQTLSRDVEAKTLGAAIRQSLAASQDSVAHPTDWNALLQPLLICAKIKSWNALQKSAKMCGVEKSNVELRIVPSRNGGTSGSEKGYHSLPEKTIVIAADCSAEQLGSALSQALELCC